TSPPTDPRPRRRRAGLAPGGRARAAGRRWPLAGIGRRIPAMRRLHFGLLGSLVLAPTAATQRTPDLPVTVAEQSGFTRTSRLEDVRAFLGELAGLPAGERLDVGVFGESHEGRDLLIVRVRGEEEPAEERLRVLVVANIHGGEVCGKEALQMLLR